MYFLVSLDLLRMIHFPGVRRDPKQQLRCGNPSLEHRAYMLLCSVESGVPARSTRTAVIGHDMDEVSLLERLHPDLSRMHCETDQYDRLSLAVLKMVDVMVSRAMVQACLQR